MVFLLGLFFRLYHAFYGARFGAHNWSDMKTYADIAHDIGRGVWKETHFFQSIGYPLLMNALGTLERLSFFHVTTSALTLFFMYLMTSEAFGKKTAFVSLVIGAFHLPWILFGNFTLPETAFGFLLSVCGFASVKILKEKNTLAFAVVWGLAFEAGMWLKGTHVLMGPIFLIVILFLQKKKAIIPCAIISSIVFVGMVFHGFYSNQHVGKTFFSATAGGLNFVEGKCPAKVNKDSRGYEWQSPIYYQLDNHTRKKWNRPFTDSKYFFSEGMKCIKKDPFVLIQSLEGIPLLLTGNLIWPLNVTMFKEKSRLYELFFSLFLIPGLILFFAYAMKEQNKIFLAWLVPMLALSLCVYIFKSEARFRVPFDSWFISAGVVGWFYLISVLQKLELHNEKRIRA